MKARPECVPCQVSFALKTIRKATEEEAVAEELILEALRLILSFGLDCPPPRVAREVVGLVRGRTGVEDPFRGDKVRQNRQALALYPYLRRRLAEASDPLREALLLSAAGNLMDSIALKEGDDPQEVFSTALSGIRFARDHYRELKAELVRAKRLLLVGDNAGEVVMDRLLVEELKGRYPALEVLYAVRGRPTINDVTLREATEVGMTELCRVVPTGDYTPGVILEFCSPEFRDAFGKADLVIAKGQGNFETLEELADPRIFFLLRAKCPTIIHHLGLSEGAPVLFRRLP